MAEVRTYAEQCPVGGGIIHLGATSMDIEDNADALRLREALRLIRQRLADAAGRAGRADRGRGRHVAMAYTHLQPAEPTTLGYRLASTPRISWRICEALDVALPLVRGKGFKGAVGTSASYAHLLAGTRHDRRARWRRASWRGWAWRPSP